MRHAWMITAALAAAAGSLAAQENVVLRISGQPGQFNRYQSVLEVWSRGGPMASVGGDTTQPIMRRTQFVTRTVAAVRGDTLEFTEAVDSARVETPANPQMAAMMGGAAALTGQVTTTQLGTRGQIYGTSVSGGAMGPAGGGGGGGGGNRGRGMAGMGRNARAMFLFPERAVRVGETWTDSMLVPGPNPYDPPANFLATYQLQRIDVVQGHRIAILTVDGTTAAQSPTGPQRTSVSGEYQIDLTNNRLASVTLNTTGTMATMQQGDVPIRTRLTQSLIP